MIGIGLDAVEIERFRRAVERHPRILDRIFTTEERDDMSERVDPVPGLAARFAVREAVMKAMGVGIGDVAFADIAVRRSPSGRPAVELRGAAAKLASELGITTWQISISHTRDSAMAVAAAL